MPLEVTNHLLSPIFRSAMRPYCPRCRGDPILCGSLGSFFPVFILFIFKSSFKKYLHLLGYRTDKAIKHIGNIQVEPRLIVHFILFGCHGMMASHLLI